MDSKRKVKGSDRQKDGKGMANELHTRIGKVSWN